VNIAGNTCNTDCEASIGNKPSLTADLRAAFYVKTRTTAVSGNSCGNYQDVIHFLRLRVPRARSSVSHTAPYTALDSARATGRKPGDHLNRYLHQLLDNYIGVAGDQCDGETNSDLERYLVYLAVR
jgi:hypothetical protein